MAEDEPEPGKTGRRRQAGWLAGGRGRQSLREERSSAERRGASRRVGEREGRPGPDGGRAGRRTACGEGPGPVLPREDEGRAAGRAREAPGGYDAGAVTEVLGVFLAALAVVGLSIFLLGLGSLLKRRCSLRPCGSREEAGDACAECPLAKPERAEPA